MVFIVGVVMFAIWVIGYLGIVHNKRNLRRISMLQTILRSEQRRYDLLQQRFSVAMRDTKLAEEATFVKDYLIDELISQVGEDRADTIIVTAYRTYHSNKKEA